MTEYDFEINGSPYRVKIKETRAGHAVVEVNGTEYRVDIKTPASPPPQSASTPTPLPIEPKAVPERGAALVLDDFKPIRRPAQVTNPFGQD